MDRQTLAEAGSGAEKVAGTGTTRLGRALVACWRAARVGASCAGWLTTAGAEPRRYTGRLLTLDSTLGSQGRTGAVRFGRLLTLDSTVGSQGRTVAVRFGRLLTGAVRRTTAGTGPGRYTFRLLTGAVRRTTAGTGPGRYTVRLLTLDSTLGSQGRTGAVRRTTAGTGPGRYVSRPLRWSLPTETGP